MTNVPDKTPVDWATDEKPKPLAEIARLCPSARALVKALRAEAPGSVIAEVDALVSAHLAFAAAIANLSGRQKDKSEAVTDHNAAFAWALKAVCDDVL